MLPDLFNKVEQIRFDYPNIKFMGRLWTKRKMIVFDKLSNANLESKYTYLQDFIKVAEHYVEGIDAYQIILPKTDNKGEVYMNTLSVFIDECFWGPTDQRSSGKSNSGGMRKLKLKRTL